MCEMQVLKMSAVQPAWLHVPQNRTELGDVGTGQPSGEEGEATVWVLGEPWGPLGRVGSLGRVGPLVGGEAGMDAGLAPAPVAVKDRTAAGYITFTVTYVCYVA